MAQLHRRIVEEIVEIAPESPVGTPGTYTRLTHVKGSFDDGSTIEQLDPMDASTEPFDRITTIDGFSRAAPTWKMKAKAPGTQLDATATGDALTLAGNCPNLLPLYYVMGGLQTAAGSLVAASPSPTATGFSVTATQGDRLLPGQIIFVEYGGTLHATVVATRSTDAITLAIALPGAPSTGAKVINSLMLYADPANTSSFAVRQTNVHLNNMYAFTKCTGDFELGYTRGQLIELTMKARAAAFGDAEDAGEPAYEADIHGSKGFALKDALTILQPIATTTRTQYRMRDLAFSFKQGMVHTEEQGTDGVDSVIRTGDRNFVEVKITGPYDADLVTYARNKTPLRFFHAVPYGSGTTKKHWAVHCPRGFILGDPKRKNTGDLLEHEYTFVAQIDPTLSTTAQKSPIYIATG